MLRLLFYLLFREEEFLMIDMYCVLIVNGKRNIDSVPGRYRQAVVSQLNDMGLDENGNVME